MRAVADASLDFPFRVWRLRSPLASAYRPIAPHSLIHTGKKEQFTSLRRSSPARSRLWFSGALAVSLGCIRGHWMIGRPVARRASNCFTNLDGRVELAPRI